MTLEEQKYPIGRFVKPEKISEIGLKNFISEIRTLPDRLRKEVDTLSDNQLNTTYRDGGWTLRQVVNHCADSHMNGFIRIKLALTEDRPTIKPYQEERWAQLQDTSSIPVSAALKTLDGLHERWTILLESLTRDQLQRTYIHPADETERRVDETIATYAWHGNHHLAHITSLKKQKGWK
ncbi:putative metal-dependent hydrolase [Salinimicrobium marinum]|uniref:Metal-dependent hydrolase n=1 Tax=Salinimicrobium marinum TaxID=680283 RepID=A0A918VVM8_9FLAO|nr:putative metal-dependent hydrolase [Salinimicrobium marinum]GHA33662.1 putative metal-dependent hydrolase [Salinimicrobium marinum]